MIYQWLAVTILIALLSGIIFECLQLTKVIGIAQTVEKSSQVDVLVIQRTSMIIISVLVL